MRRAEEQNAKPTPPEESVRVYVSGYMAQTPTPRHFAAQQLQTPPNTSIMKKKERPSSWEIEDESRKKATWVGNNGILEGATGIGAEDVEDMLIRTTSPTAVSVTTPSCNVNVFDLNHSRSTGELAPIPSCRDVANIDTKSNNLSPSDYGSDSTDSPATNPIDDGDAAVEKADFGGQVLVAIDSEDDNDASTILFGNRCSESNIANKDLYPQLPMRNSSECTNLNEAILHARPKTRPNLPMDRFNPALDFIPLCTSSDYEDLFDDVTELDHISANGPRTEPRLCDEQLALVELIMNGKNVFYTGSAGCGKSTVLKHFVALLRREGKTVDILAPTGRAALEINGRTLYNFAGWYPRSLGQPLWNLESNARGEKVWKRLTRTHVLIIDEISMVANHVFERLSCIMKSARGSEKPFGGVQIIVTGDFCQLPPVKGFEYCLKCGTTLRFVSWKGEYECVKCLAQYKEIDKWAFCSAAWEQCKFAHVSLDVIHRQKDADFKALLEKLRLGISYSIDEERLLLEHESETRDAVRLFPRRAEVKSINDKELAKLPGRPLTYLCVDNFYWNRKHDTLEDKRGRCPEPMSHALQALEEHSCEPKLVLKEGMLVMLVVNWNLDSSLANGSQGTIVGFEKHNPGLFPEVRPKWIHSNLKNALVKAFIQKTAVQEWPIVQFLNGSKRTIYPRCMMYELGDDEPYSLLSRTQIPLVAAWAMTVHKAQGMTLSRVIVDLTHSFEPGQDYVALSRAENLQGLKVEGLPDQRKGSDKQVIKFLIANKIMPAIDWDEYSDLKGERLKETE